MLFARSAAALSILPYQKRSSSILAVAKAIPCSFSLEAAEIPDWSGTLRVHNSKQQMSNRGFAQLHEQRCP
jgi:hypothetical protein